MKRIDIDIKCLPQPRHDRASHSLISRDSGMGGDVRIDPSVEIELLGNMGTLPVRRTLGRIIENLAGLGGAAKISLAEADAVGRMLGELVWGTKPAPPMEEFWINTTDPLVAGLPWALTQQAEAASLIAQNVPVAVQVQAPLLRQRAGLPKNPVLLFVAGAETDWSQHRQDMTAALGEACRIEPMKPRTLDDLIDALTKFSPDILYYYGHGTIEDGGHFHLAVNGLAEEATKIPAEKLRRYLMNARHTPVGMKLNLLYLNCCWSGVSLAQGGPFTLGELVPAFIANRASAITRTVASQAIEILQHIVQLGAAPHMAVHAAQHASYARRRNATRTVEKEDEPWWMTPTVFANYAEWGQARPFSEKIVTGYDSLRLDRIPQCGGLRESLKAYDDDRATLPPILLVVWHGQKDDGLHSLAERLSLQLCDPVESRGALLSAREIAWPTDYHALDATMPPVEARQARRKLLADRLVETLGRDGWQPSARPPANVAMRARALLRRGGGRAMWCHAPIDLAALGDPADPVQRKQRLKTMMNDLAIVLNDSIAASVHDRNQSPLSLLALLRVDDIGIDVAEVIGDVIDENKTSVAILPLEPLGILSLEDIRTFLVPIAGRDGNTRWKDRLRKIARRIHDTTKGRYEPTRYQLENIEIHVAATEDD